MNLSGAFGAAVGVGSATAISLKLGQKDYLTAEEILGNTVTLNLIIGFSFAVICFIRAQIHLIFIVFIIACICNFYIKCIGYKFSS